MAPDVCGTLGLALPNHARQRRLDAGTGTGFAALAAAGVVGRAGRVVAVDLSAGMLSVARDRAAQMGAEGIEWVHGDATMLTDYSPATFDVVTCAAALLYMPVARALAEWHRVLKPGGVVAFSGMKTGSPLAGRLFRECAAMLGIQLYDPSEALGPDSACRSALLEAGFSATSVTLEALTFSASDVAVAWESNLRSAHVQAPALIPADVALLKASFERAVARERQRDPAAMERAEVLYVLGRAAAEPAAGDGADV